MKNVCFSQYVSAPLLLLAVSAFGFMACSDGTPVEPGPKVEVPEVPGDVAAEDFCKLFDQIHCAGAVGCCDAAEAQFAGEAECLAASPCQASLGALLSSPLLADGTVGYDAKAAGDYLRAKAGVTSVCDASKDSSSSPTFLAGTLDQGADCSAQSADVAGAYACKPGLQCKSSEDPVTGLDSKTCAPATALGGDGGDACTADEDCRSGACVSGACEADATAPLCAAWPEVVPPPNWTQLNTTTAPQELRVTAHSDGGSGTSDDITLVYRNATATYSCTITATIADGGSQTCTPSQSSTTTSTSGFDYFYVKYADKNNSYNYDDGLRVTEVAVKHNNTWYYLGSFSSGDLDCSGCDGLFNDTYCNACWLDGDGHGSCKEIKLELKDNYDTWCL